MRNFNSTFLKRLFRNRKGSQIAEAAMVLPVAILLFSGLVCILISFYVNLTEQIAEHAAEREELYQFREISILRIKDSMSHVQEEGT